MLNKLGFDFAAELNADNIKLYKRGIGITLNERLDCTALRKRIESVCEDLSRQHLVAVADTGATDISVADEKSMLYGVGFPELLFIQPTVALASYLGYKFIETVPVMSVVIGRTATDIAIIQADKILYSGIIDVGYNSGVRAFMSFAEEKFGMDLSFETARLVIDEIGSLLPNDTRYCKFNEFVVKAEQVRGIIYLYYEQIIGAISHILSAASVDVVRAIKNSGIVFGGVGASVRGLADAVYAKLGLQSIIADDPDNAVLLGAGGLLADPKILIKVAADA
jgi:rod shape-determining protein MreB